MKINFYPYQCLNFVFRNPQYALIICAFDFSVIEIGQIEYFLVRRLHVTKIQTILHENGWGE